MPFVVVYDANALYGNAQRDLLIRIAQSGLVQAKWTEQILDEMFSNLGKRRPDIPADRLSILRERMNMAVRDCLVTGYEPLIESLRLPDLDDRHVLAVAIKSSAQVIVTTNLKDFPEAELGQWTVEAKSPDDFVLDQIHIDARIVWRGRLRRFRCRGGEQADQRAGQRDVGRHQEGGAEGPADLYRGGLQLAGHWT
jgi:predicted nucleic acid-binding protein